MFKRYNGALACNPLGAGLLILNTIKIKGYIKLLLQDLPQGLQDVGQYSHFLDYTNTSVSTVQQTKMPVGVHHIWEGRQVEGLYGIN